MTAETFPNWSIAFDVCRERNQSLVVSVDGEICKIFPSGRCVNFGLESENHNRGIELDLRKDATAGDSTAAQTAGAVQQWVWSATGMREVPPFASVHYIREDDYLRALAALRLAGCLPRERS